MLHLWTNMGDGFFCYIAWFIISWIVLVLLTLLLSKFQSQASRYGKVSRHTIKMPIKEASISTDLTFSKLCICLQSDLLSGFKQIFKAECVHQYFTHTDQPPSLPRHLCDITLEYTLCILSVDIVGSSSLTPPRKSHSLPSPAELTLSRYFSLQESLRVSLLHVEDTTPGFTAAAYLFHWVNNQVGFFFP